MGVKGSITIVSFSEEDESSSGLIVHECESGSPSDIGVMPWLFLLVFVKQMAIAVSP